MTDSPGNPGRCATATSPTPPRRAARRPPRWPAFPDVGTAVTGRTPCLNDTRNSAVRIPAGDLCELCRGHRHTVAAPHMQVGQIGTLTQGQAHREHRGHW